MSRETRARVIPRGLGSNESFIKDLRKFLEFPVESVAELVETVDPSRFTVLKSGQLEDLAARFDADASAVRSAMLVAGYLRSRAQELGVPGHQIVGEIRELLTTQEEAPDIPASLSTIFSYTEEDRRETLARQAFSAPPTFLAADFRPIFTTVETARGDLVGGFLCTIHYLDSEGASRSLAFALTPGELQEIQTLAEEAQGKLKEAVSSLNLGADHE